MSWTRRRAFVSLLVAFILGGAVVCALEKCKRRPDSSLSSSPTLDALVDGSLPVPEPVPVAEPSAAVPVSDPALLASIRHSLVPVSTTGGAGEEPTNQLPAERVQPTETRDFSPNPPVAGVAPLPEPPSASIPLPPVPPLPPPLPAPSPPGLPLPRSPGATPAPPPAAPVPCPWTLRLEIVDGRTQLEARSGKEVHFRVSCARLDLQAPQGCLQAQGTVQVSGVGLEGVCERLTLSWEHDQVLLEGKVHLKCHKDGQEVELTADRLRVRLNTLAPAQTVDAVEVLPVAPQLKVVE